jgi:succinylglutamic semialdehyde dehydrogenase
VITVCRAGQLSIVTGDSVVAVDTQPTALATAFRSEVWLAESDTRGSRIRRLSLSGATRDVIDLGEVGAPLYMRPLLPPHLGTVIGLEGRAAIISQTGDEVLVKSLPSPQVQVIPARHLIYLRDGVAEVTQSGVTSRLSELRVHDGWPLRNGASVALLGEDARSPAVDIVGMRPGERRTRMRVSPGVLMGTASQKSALVFISERTFTIYDTVRSSRIGKRKLATSPVDLAVSANGIAAVVLDTHGNVDIIPIDDRAQSSLAGHRDRVRALGPGNNADDASSGADAAAVAEVIPESVPAPVDPDRAETIRGDSLALTNTRVWGSMIDGQFIDGEPAGELSSRSPADPERELGIVCYGADDVEMAVSTARAHTSKWADSRLSARVSALKRFDAELEARSRQLVETMSVETGRPIWECQREVRGLSQRLHYTIGSAPAALESSRDTVASSSLHKRPWGVVAIIGPAMFPLATSHQHIVAAIVAGNTLVWKPSPLCPATSRLYTEALRAADFPPGVVNVVVGPDHVGAELAARPEVDCVVFTGSRAHGMELQRALEGTSTKLVLHLGAKNPAIVAADCLIELAAFDIATSAFLTAGQRCTAVSRVFVERPVLDQLGSRLSAVAQKLVIGPPELEAFCGPLLTEERLDRFTSAIDAAPAQGASVLLASERIERPGYFVRPSIHVIDEIQDSAYQHDEHFGPDLALYPVDSSAEALALCNDGTDDLCAAIFTENPTTWEHFAGHAKFGTIMRNMGTHAVSGRLPFGSARASRSERGGGAAILTMCREVSTQERREYVIDVYPGMKRPE